MSRIRGPEEAGLHPRPGEPHDLDSRIEAGRARGLEAAVKQSLQTRLDALERDLRAVVG
jgi:hypothetical protein